MSVGQNTQAPPQGFGGRVVARLPRGVRAISWVGILLGLVAAWIALPPLTVRTALPSIAIAAVGITLGAVAVARRDVRYGIFAIVTGHARDHPGDPRRTVGRRQAQQRRRLVGALCRHAPVCDAADVRVARWALLGAIRGGEHRSRGHDADGRVLRDSGGRQDGLLGARPADRRPRRRRARLRACVLLDLAPRRPDRRRHGDQLPRARDHGLPVHRHLRHRRDADRHAQHPERSPRRSWRGSRSSATSSGTST